MSISLIPAEVIENRILLLRGHKVMLDSDLSTLYGVETRTLIQAVKRNLYRFPADFIFKLNNQELMALRSQIVISNAGRGGRRYTPYAFTEYGVAMLSSVLNSKRAIKVNIEIMRAFVRLRQVVGSQKVLAKKMEELESKVGKHDKAINALFETIYEMMNPIVEEKPKIGFNPG